MTARATGRWRTGLLLAVWVAALGLSGCGLLKQRDDQAAAKAAEPLRDMYLLQIKAPDELAPLLNTYLDLARFQRAPESDRITSAELDRLVAAARTQARTLVETQGYFNPEVDVRRLPDNGAGLPVVALTLSAGPRTVIAQATLALRGPLQDRAAAGDAAARAEVEALRRRWPLRSGRPFTQSAWADGKDSAVAPLRADGHAAAELADSAAKVDATANTASLYVLVDSGPLFRYGELKIEGLARYRAQAVRNLATFSPGDRYTEKALLDTQERLQRSGLFEGAVVELDPDPATAAAAPVTVRLRELPLQQATVGVGYSDATGQRLSLEHTHRMVFGRSFFGTDLTSKNKFELGRDQQLWEGDLSTHPLSGGWRNLVGVKLLRQASVGTTVGSARLRVGRSQESERLERIVFAEYEQASTRSDVLNEFSRALSLNVGTVRRDVDNALLPTRGLSFNAQAGAGYAWSGSAPNGPFARLYGKAVAYRPLGDRWYATGRVEVGQLLSRSVVAVPDTLLFRAGGDDSVRGYDYRSLGPQVGGITTSGRVLLTTSAEVARPISNRLPSVWWAVFADAGNAATGWRELKPVLGYGAGVRWRSPVGPLRLDLAYADELRKFRFHLSVGIAL